MPIVNKKAFHDYFVMDKIECGLSLRGNEVKSIRAGKMSIKEAWVKSEGNHLILVGSHISKWDTANSFDVDEKRDRTLLAHKKEIVKLANLVKQDGVTLIPLEVIEKKGKFKLIVGICKGKHNYDKRESMKKKAIERDIARSLK